MKKIALLGAAGVIGLSGVAAAQTATTDGSGTSTTTTVTTSTGTTTTPTGTTTTGTTSTAGAYDHLSPGNKSIVDALYKAQIQPSTTGTTTTTTGPTPLTRDQIAAMGPGAGGEGWGNVFKDMKAQGLTDAKNLGEVVSSNRHDVNGDRKGGTSATDSLSASSSTTTSRGKFVRDDSSVGITTGRGTTEVATRGNANGSSKSGVTSGRSSSNAGAVSHGSVTAGISNAGGNAGGNSGSHGGGNGKH
jgi:hypothetical protein